MTKLFFSYSHADETFRDTLEKHLAAMKHEGLIDTWHDRRIPAGDELDTAIDENLEQADVILLLVSSDFIASRYCYDIEMKRALERHHERTSRVIPVILRHCDWQNAPFAKLLAAPTDGKPIKSWADIDEAYTDVVGHIRRALAAMGASPKQQEATQQAPSAAKFGFAEPETVSSPHASARSSNMRVKKTFSDADRERFLEDSFAFMSRFFENSLKELADRNPGIEGRFRQIDANRFTCVIYADGKAISRCKIMLGGMFGRGITYSANDSASDGSVNENLSVENDDQDLYFKPLMGAGFYNRQDKAKLSTEGAAELFWSMLMWPLQ
ncbi:toll/interleukin-1 receptor domain-containing protein [Martelella lutilitoris]|uniref:Toll/interleukin-1 receptor domain-containing protein n=1 Tax=Martelella lutilitoris TaxID=2583532 RepID=A0A7T7HNA1_9HYPH|nr:toll/interleukin-1 receptor domain-containing protein [Martelella lutilitoris]QQM32365.1 toll/interleukin-1 receptor domain-containing protein [Martelella lutilitoris]